MVQNNRFIFILIWAFIVIGKLAALDISSEKFEDSVQIQSSDETFYISKNYEEILSKTCLFVKNQKENCDSQDNDSIIYFPEGMSKAFFSSFFPFIDKIFSINNAFSIEIQKDNESKLKKLIRAEIKANKIIPILQAANYLEVEQLFQEGVNELISLYPKYPVAFDETNIASRLLVIIKNEFDEMNNFIKDESGEVDLDIYNNLHVSTLLTSIWQKKKIIDKFNDKKQDSCVKNFYSYLTKKLATEEESIDQLLAEKCKFTEELSKNLCNLFEGKEVNLPSLDFQNNPETQQLLYKLPDNIQTRLKDKMEILF